MDIALARIGNLLYRHLPRAYRPLYGLYKAISDRRERALLRQAIAPGMTVVDVGANIGTYAEFLAGLVGGEGIVHAFEPEPQNFALLSQVAASRGNIRAINSAVGDSTGTLKLFVSGDLNVDHHTYDDGEGRAAVEVPVVRLDDFFPPGARVDLVKLDIQGYELQALRGAERVLTENRDVRLLVEYWPWGLRRAGSEPGAIPQYLRGLGFTVEVPGLRAPGGLPGIGEGINDYANIFASRQV